MTATPATPDAEFEKLTLNHHTFDVDQRGKVLTVKPVIQWEHKDYIQMLLHPELPNLATITKLPDIIGKWHPRLSAKPVEFVLVKAVFLNHQKNVVSFTTDIGYRLDCGYKYDTRRLLPISWCKEEEPKPTEDGAATDKAPVPADYVSYGLYHGNRSMVRGAASFQAFQVRVNDHEEQCPLAPHGVPFHKWQYKNEWYARDALCMCNVQTTGEPRWKVLCKKLEQSRSVYEDEAPLGLFPVEWGVTRALAMHAVVGMTERRINLQHQGALEYIVLYLAKDESSCDKFRDMLMEFCSINSISTAVDDTGSVFKTVMGKFITMVHIKTHAFIEEQKDPTNFSFPADTVYVDDICDFPAVKPQIWNYFYRHAYDEPTEFFLMGTTCNDERRVQVEQEWLALKDETEATRIKMRSQSKKPTSKAKTRKQRRISE